MELTPDALYSVALNLKGEDLMKMCSTNNQIRRICTSQKFNPIWTRNLLKEYNVKYNGNNAYMEYLQHAYLYKQTYWVASVFDKNDMQIVTNKIFKNHSDAALFLANEAMKYHVRNPLRIEFFTYLSVISEQGKFEDAWNRYEITEGEFETKSQESKYYDFYINKLKDIYNLLTLNNTENNKDFDKLKEEIQIIISDIDDGDNDYFYETKKSEAWERFKNEVLPSYIETPDKNQLKAIKDAFMKFLDEEGDIDDDDDDDDDDMGEIMNLRDAYEDLEDYELLDVSKYSKTNKRANIINASMLENGSNRVQVPGLAIVSNNRKNLKSALRDLGYDDADVERWLMSWDEKIKMDSDSEDHVLLDGSWDENM